MQKSLVTLVDFFTWRSHENYTGKNVLNKCVHRMLTNYCFDG